MRAVFAVQSCLMYLKVNQTAGGFLPDYIVPLKTAVMLLWLCFCHVILLCILMFLNHDVLMDRFFNVLTDMIDLYSVLNCYSVILSIKHSRHDLCGRLDNI